MERRRLVSGLARRKTCWWGRGDAQRSEERSPREREREMSRLLLQKMRGTSRVDLCILVSSSPQHKPIRSQLTP